MDSWSVTSVICRGWYDENGDTCLLIMIENGGSLLFFINVNDLKLLGFQMISER